MSNIGGANGWSKYLSIEILDSDLGLDLNLYKIITQVAQLTEYLDEVSVKFNCVHKFKCLKEHVISGLALDDTNYFLRESGHFFINKQGEQKLMVYAQVRANKQVYLAYQNKLNALDQSPIGPSWLFKDQQIKRSEFEFKNLSVQEYQEYQEYQDPEKSIYLMAQKWGMVDPLVARRSFFNKGDARFGDLQLQIIEVFSRFEI